MIGWLINYSIKQSDSATTHSKHCANSMAD